MASGFGSVLVDIGGWLLILVVLIVIGWISGRILGVHRGLVRATVAGVLGFLAGWLYISIADGGVTWDEPFAVLRSGGIFLVTVLLVTMFASISLDALFRPRAQRRHVRLPRPLRAIRRRLAIVVRVRQIMAAARRNGLIDRRLARSSGFATPEGARALRRTLEDAGGLLVKFGQIASTREDLLPPVLTTELAELRTAVPGLPADVVREVVEAELGAPIETLFAEFDFTALAAASIGVTHRAVLPGGRRVIVKVQRPGIEDLVVRDGRVLRWSAEQIQRRSQGAATLGIVALADELIRGVTAELDFTREAANNAAMRRAGSVPGVAYPEILRDLTTRRVLVMDEVVGRPVSDQAAVSAGGIPVRTLSENLLTSFLNQVLQSGVYHADPHPGNILIDAGGTLWFIDYGAVGFLDPVTLEALQQMALGFSLRDPSLLARSVRRMAGSAGERIDVSSLEFELGVALTDVEGGGFDPHSLQMVLRVLSRHGVALPRALTVLARAMLTLDGTLRILDPGFRMGPSTQSHLTDMISAAHQDPRQEVMREVVRSLPSLRSLPQLGEDIGLQVRSGRLTLRTTRYAGTDRLWMQYWIDTVVFAAVGVMGLLASVLMFVAAGMDGNQEWAAFLRIIGGIGLFISVAMQMRAIARILSRPEPTADP